MAELKNFLDSEGRLKQFPAKRLMKLQAILYVASKLPADAEMTEREVNELLDRWATFGDRVTLRRELVDHGCLLRDSHGRSYRVAVPQPTLEELEALYPT